MPTPAVGTIGSLDYIYGRGETDFSKKIEKLGMSDLWKGFYETSGG